MNIVDDGDYESLIDPLLNGGIVIVPTKRWYMLCCDAKNEAACRVIYHYKKRPEDKSLLLVVPELYELEKCFSLTTDAKSLIDSFWPGDIALQVPWIDEELSNAYSSMDSQSVLIFRDSSPLTKLAQEADILLAATSANVSGNPPALSLEDVSQFINKSNAEIAGVMDGDICPYNQHLTIVNCLDQSAKISREGIVSHQSIEQCLNLKN